MRRVQKVITLLLIVAMLITSVAATAVAAELPAVEQEGATNVLSAATVTGTLTGGQFAKIWLGLTPQSVNENVSLVADWDRENATTNGVGFFVLNPAGLQAVVNGGSLLENNIAAGTPVVNGGSNQQATTFFADGNSFTVVLFNDSATDATFTVRVTNGTVQDDSGQVRDPNAPLEAAPAASDVPATDAAATTEPVVVTSETTTTTVVSTTTVATTATAATTVTAVVPGTPFVLRAEQVQGSLPEQNDQHYLGLVPSERDSEITLTLTFDPADSSELSRRLNFWVLDTFGLNAYVGGANASEVAIAAGNRTFTGLSNERVAVFQSVGVGPYTVIVYNNSQVPASYTLIADGATIEDDSLQTTTAQQQAGTVGLSAAAAATAGTPAATTSAATTTTAAAAATATREGEPGGTYTVKAGDTVALIARDIYGDYTLYQAICTFNGMTDCNRIEIGDIIKLPTQDQIGANAVAPATTAPATTAAAATPAATSAAATPAATTATTTTAATGTGAAAATPAATAAATPAATPTRAASTTTGNSVVDVAADNGNFDILIQALEAAGLDDDLNGAGPFTLFAPTDAAFNALGAATVDALLKEPAKLRSILLYHVVNGEVMSDSLEDGMEAKTLQGDSIGFTLSGATAKVQDSNIVVPDLAAGNGVIHVIDKVMLPPTL